MLPTARSELQRHRVLWHRNLSEWSVCNPRHRAALTTRRVSQRQWSQNRVPNQDPEARVQVAAAPPVPPVKSNNPEAELCCPWQISSCRFESQNVRRVLRSCAVAVLVTLVSCRGCRSSNKVVFFNCTESKNECYCVAREPSVDIPERLCGQEYECCIQHLEVAESQGRLTCECWNPDGGGLTCESRLSKSEALTRVRKCQ